MVFGGKPENRHGFDAAARGLASTAGGRNRFVKGVGRAGKDPHLLAGYNGDGASRQAIDIPFGRGIRTEAPVLLAQDFCDTLAHLG